MKVLTPHYFHLIFLFAKAAVIFGLMLGLSSCGGGGGDERGVNAASVMLYTVNGSVSGLSGSGLVLQNNGADDQPVASNGAFTFTTPVSNGSRFNVTVKTLPVGSTQICTVNNGTGTVAGSDINNVSVVCSANTYLVSGSVSGLGGVGLVLQNNAADAMTINADGSFTFPTPVADGANYNVTVLTQPSDPAQTCTVNGGSGPITNTNISNVFVSCSTSTYTISGTVSGFAGAGLVLQNNGADDQNIAANGTFHFATPVVNGANYNVTVKTQPAGPAQTCNVNSGSGTVYGGNISDVVVTCITPVQSSVPKFAYVANAASNDVSVYTINPDTGALTPVATVAAGISPSSVTVDPSGKFVYVTNSSWSDSTTSVYTIDRTSGALTWAQAAGNPNFKLGYEVTPHSAAVDPAGKFAYVANLLSGSISVFAINPATGTLTEVGVTMYESLPYFITVDPTGKFVYLVNRDYITAYTINPTNGLLTLSSQVGAGMHPMSMTIDPGGKFAYVVTDASSDVLAYLINVYAIDQTSGSLTLVAMVDAGAGTYPVSIDLDPVGKFAYVANSQSNDVSVYSINPSTGELASTGLSAPAGISPESITVDASGKFVYVANYGSNDVSMYTINQTTGALTPTLSVAAGLNPASITTTR